MTGVESRAVRKLGFSKNSCRYQAISHPICPGQHDQRIPACLNCPETSFGDMCRRKISPTLSWNVIGASIQTSSKLGCVVSFSFRSALRISPTVHLPRRSAPNHESNFNAFGAVINLGRNVRCTMLDFRPWEAVRGR